MDNLNPTDFNSQFFFWHASHCPMLRTDGIDSFKHIHELNFFLAINGQLRIGKFLENMPINGSEASK